LKTLTSAIDCILLLRQYIIPNYHALMKVVIFCGGYGTRFWPISRKSTPKQFVPFLNGKSFFQVTYARYRKKFKPEEIFVATEGSYISFVRKQAPEIPQQNIIPEPERKDLLAACGLATAVVNKYFTGESILISWAKHLINKESVFLNAIIAAGDFAEKSGLIVSVDSKPSYPSVHNGWVKLGRKLDKINGFEVVEIEKHVEKPDIKTAEKLFKEGKWLINTGYRVWKSDTFLNYYKQLQPQMYKGLEKIAKAWGGSSQDRVLKNEYHKFVKDSVEYGIFEKLPGSVRATIAADMGWQDVGISWELFYKSLKNARKDSVVVGGAKTKLIDSADNLVIGPSGKMISIIGVSNIVVADTPDGLLVCNLKDTQKVKDLYEFLERKHKEYVE
jgi:mannose-1-phosphate guanylyltransferase